jgi:hypothetical protein
MPQQNNNNYNHHHWLPAHIEATRKEYKNGTDLIFNSLAELAGNFDESTTPYASFQRLRSRLLGMAWHIVVRKEQPSEELRQTFETVILGRAKVTVYYKGLPNAWTRQSRENTQRHEYFNKQLHEAYHMLFGWTPVYRK